MSSVLGIYCPNVSDSTSANGVTASRTNASRIFARKNVTFGFKSLISLSHDTHGLEQSYILSLA